MLQGIEKGPWRPNVFIHCDDPRQRSAGSLKTVLDTQDRGHSWKLFLTSARFHNKGIHRSNQGSVARRLETIDDPRVTRDEGNTGAVIKEINTLNPGLTGNPIPQGIRKRLDINIIVTVMVRCG